MCCVRRQPMCPLHCRRPVLLCLHRAVGSARDGPLREIVFGRSLSEPLPNLSAVLSRRRVLGLQRSLPAVLRSVSTLFIFTPLLALPSVTSLYNMPFTKRLSDFVIVGVHQCCCLWVLFLFSMCLETSSGWGCLGLVLVLSPLVLVWSWF